jgi:hypothetical protein
MYHDSIRATSRPERKLSADEWVCTRCGYISDNGKPHKSGECSSCRLVEYEPVRVQTFREISSGHPELKGRCRAWLRGFTDDDQPIDENGFAVFPGERLCGHSDCVNPSHIIPADALLVA